MWYRSYSASDSSSLNVFANTSTTAPGQADCSVPVRRVLQDGERGLDLEQRDHLHAFGRRRVDRHPAAPKPWSSRICVNAPPAEWPMMIGGGRVSRSGS